MPKARSSPRWHRRCSSNPSRLDIPLVGFGVPGTEAPPQAPARGAPERRRVGLVRLSPTAGSVGARYRAAGRGRVAVGTRRFRAITCAERTQHEVHFPSSSSRRRERRIAGSSWNSRGSPAPQISVPCSRLAKRPATGGPVFVSSGPYGGATPTADTLERDRMGSVVVCGSGACGLLTATLLAKAGHEVTVLERDAAAPPAMSEAWEMWQRR